MSFALFNVSPRPFSPDIENGTRNSGTHVLQAEVHIKKTSEFVCGDVRLSELLTFLTVVSMIIIAALGFNSARWFLLLITIDLLGIVGYVRGSSYGVAFYMFFLSMYLATMLFILIGISTSGVEITSKVFLNLKIESLARYCDNPDIACFLIVLIAFMAIRIGYTYKYIEFVYFNELFSKLNTQTYILKAC